MQARIHMDTLIYLPPSLSSTTSNCYTGVLQKWSSVSIFPKGTETELVNVKGGEHCDWFQIIWLWVNNWVVCAPAYPCLPIRISGTSCRKSSGLRKFSYSDRLPMLWLASSPQLDKMSCGILGLQVSASVKHVPWKKNTLGWFGEDWVPIFSRFPLVIHEYPKARDLCQWDFSSLLP